MEQIEYPTKHKWTIETMQKALLSWAEESRQKRMARIDKTRISDVEQLQELLGV